MSAASQTLTPATFRTLAGTSRPDRRPSMPRPSGPRVDAKPELETARLAMTRLLRDVRDSTGSTSLVYRQARALELVNEGLDKRIASFGKIRSDSAWIAALDTIQKPMEALRDRLALSEEHKPLFERAERITNAFAAGRPEVEAAVKTQAADRQR